MQFSALSKNGGPWEIEAYPVDELQKRLANPERDGWTFEKWVDADGQVLCAENLTDGKLYYAQWIDRVPPVLQISTTKKIAPCQEVLMEAEDIASAIYGYYVGTENPAETEVTYIQNSAKEYRTEITGPGRYYFSVQDTCGNVKSEMAEFISLEFEVSGDEEAECTSVLGKVGDTALLPEAKKKGHVFIGWVVKAEDSEEQNPLTEYICTEPVTFEPVFESAEYQIYLDGNGGVCEETSVAAIFGFDYPKLPTATRTGYRFLGWSPDRDGELLTKGAKYDFDCDSTIYARWEPIQYTVCYLGNGNTGGEMESMTCTYDVEFTHPRNAYTKEGYVFKGWSTNPETISTQNALTARERSYNGAEWLNEDSAINITAEADSVINLYAVWQKIEVGVMDYRYCMGKYMYFACTTLSYKTENATDNGALFVGMTPAGLTTYGPNAIWANSGIRANLNDPASNDMTGLKTTDTTVNYSYAGVMWEYDPTKQCPCTRADQGYGTAIKRNAVTNKTETIDYMFIPDLRDCYNYYTGNEWNWFWDMNLDGTPDTIRLTGMSSDGASAEYKTCTKKIAAIWSDMGWNGRYWLRNQYTGYQGYPFYIAEYGVSACNPSHPDYAAFYSQLSTAGKYLVRPMYTMNP